MKTDPVKYWWDGPNVTPRPRAERCSRHKGLCAFDERDDIRCSVCHATHESGKCTCKTERQFTLEQVRDWARGQGMEVHSRGSVRKEVMDAFLATQDSITEIDGQGVLA